MCIYNYYRISQIPEVINYVKKLSILESDCSEKTVSESTACPDNRNNNVTRVLETTIETLKVFVFERSTFVFYIIPYYVFSERN